MLWARELEVKQWTQWISFLVCVACIALSHKVLADSPETLFSRAVQLYRDGDTQGALTAFRGAYDATKNWKILYQIAETEFAQRNYVAAVQAYEQYLEEGGDDIDSTRRAEVTAEIRRLRARISAVTVQTNVEGATVALDDEPVGTTPLPAALQLNPGVHHVSLRKPGYTDVERTVEVVGSENRTIDVLMTSHQSAARDGANESHTTRRKEAGGSALKTVGLVMAGSGIASLAVGTVFGLSAKNKNDDAAKLCTGSVCSSQRALDLTDDARSAATVSTVTLIAGGALLVGGAALFLLAPSRESKSSVRVAPQVGPGLAGLTLGGTL